MSTAVAHGENPAPDRLSPFRDRNFVLLWLGQLISSLGDAALLIAVPVSLYNDTHARGSLSLWAISAAVPTLLLGLFAGVFVDRWNRQRTMIVSDLGRACAVLLMLGVHGAHQAWLFYAATFLVAAFSCFFSPARSAVLKTLLPQGQLMQGNALMTSGMQITGLLGPALGGLLLATIHRQGVFLFDAATFLVSAACVSRARVPAGRVTPAPRFFAGVWRDMAAGVRFVAASRVLSGMMALMGIGVIGAEVSNTLEYAFVKDVWHSARLFGYLMSAFGVGMVTAGLLIAGPLRGVKPMTMLVRGFAVFTAGGAAWAFAPDAAWGAGALFVFGLGNVLLNIPMYTLFQTSTTPEMMGRVISTTSVIQRLSMLTAGALAAALTRIPLQSIFIALAGVYLLCTLLARPLLERKTKRRPVMDSPREEVVARDAASARPPH